MPAAKTISAETLLPRLRAWGSECGFADVGVATLELDRDAAHLAGWLRDGFHASMAYMARDVEKRIAPARLRPGTVTVISARMDCRPPAAPAAAVLADGTRAYIARYALGRDYHKTLRQRLKRLAERLRRDFGPFGYRVLTDSAPTLDKALARNARLGWIGKNTLLLNRKAGSSFMLGEIYCDLPVRVEDAAAPRSHCGSCTACIDACPTRAIVAPYRLDAGRCISYLTIEHHGSIPVEFRRAIGNRIFGCDDCQLACPWNQRAKLAVDPDFAVRHALDRPGLVALFGWTEAEYLQRTEGMALRRAGYRNWRRNLAIALGNAPHATAVVDALHGAAGEPDPIVREHVEWAQAEQRAKAAISSRAS